MTTIEQVSIEQVSKEQMIEKIYQEIGQYKNNELYLISKYNTETDKTEILWSNNQMPVMIGDIWEYIYNKQNWLDGKDKAQYRADLIGLGSEWKYKRLPIENQSEECITYIYNLLFNK